MSSERETKILNSLGIIIRDGTTGSRVDHSQDYRQGVKILIKLLEELSEINKRTNYILSDFVQIEEVIRERIKARDQSSLSNNLKKRLNVI